MKFLQSTLGVTMTDERRNEQIAQEDGYLLGCCAVKSRRSLPTFYRPDYGGSNTSETSITFYQTTRRNNPADSHLHARRRENLKSHLD
jgi:hypothetical protein